jgi:hypothetical protein
MTQTEYPAFEKLLEALTSGATNAVSMHIATAESLSAEEWLRLASASPNGVTFLIGQREGEDDA